MSKSIQCQYHRINKLRDDKDCCDKNGHIYEIQGRQLCKIHALSQLNDLEYKLIHSPNRPTSITEQRLLDETKMLKLRVKSGKNIN